MSAYDDDYSDIRSAQDDGRFDEMDEEAMEDYMEDLAEKFNE